MRVFIGYDSRQPLAYTVCRSSVERHAKGRVQVEPLRLDWLPITRRGLTEFTFSRYLVPWLCDYRGVALFMDGDMIARADVRDLEALADPAMAVSVVMGAKRFEWPSLMLFRCDNARCGDLTPEWVGDPTTAPQTLEWAGDRLGWLPPEWNYCVGYDAPIQDPKVIHYTAGIPCWPETRWCDQAGAWFEEREAALATVTWEALMGNSVHRKVVESMRVVSNSPSGG